MSKTIGIAVLALLSCVSADPFYFSTPYYSSGYAAALTAPVAAAIPAAPALPVPTVSTVPAVPTVTTVPTTWNPVTSLSAYAYGSGYSVNEFPVVNSASAPLIYAGSYSSALPWAYASDYYYRT